MPLRTRRALVPFAAGWGAAGVFVVGLIGGVSCKSTIANTDHCYYNAGNDTCADRYGGDLPYCATTCAGKGDNPPSPNDDGCVDSEPEQGCYSPCGGENDIADDATCLGVADSGSTSMTTAVDPTSESSDTIVAECASSADCMSPEAPICVDDECRPCGDAKLPDGECELRDATAPVCSDSGACVQCTAENPAACVETTPVCDASGVCVSCTDHDQCEYACEIATGACFPDCVRTVPGDYDTIQEALDIVADQALCVIRVAADVNGSFVIDGAPRAIMYSGDGATFSLRGSSEQPTMLVDNGATAYVEGVRFDSNGVGAIDVTGESTLYLDRVEVVGNPGDGIRVLIDSYMEMRNSIVAGNGTGAADTPGVQIYNSEAHILYSTIVDNDGDEIDTLDCSTSVVTVRNSILMAVAGQSIGCDAEITFSAVDENVPGSGNSDVSPLDLDWFTNPAGSNYNLSPTGVTIFSTIARWMTGDPLTDIDGDDRIAVDGESEPAGADVPD